LALSGMSPVDLRPARRRARAGRAPPAQSPVAGAPAAPQRGAALDKGGLRPGTPKSRAGKRTVAFPEEIAPEISWHLDRFAEPGDRGFAVAREACSLVGPCVDRDHPPSYYAIMPPSY